MNATQIKYATIRASNVMGAKLAAVREKYTVTETRLSDAETLRALAAGEFTVRKSLKPSRNAYGYLREFIILHGENDASHDKAAITREENKIRKRYEALMDKLVLGDAEDALKMLNDFEKD